MKYTCANLDFQELEHCVSLAEDSNEFQVEEIISAEVATAIIFNYPQGEKK